MQILKDATVCPRHKHKSPGEIVHPRGAQLSSGQGTRKESSPPSSSVPDQRDPDQTSVKVQIQGMEEEQGPVLWEQARQQGRSVMLCAWASTSSSVVQSNSLWASM